ncbi:uncharacterized protein LOC119673941 isoform X2 [Teleopsis dalmanni]|uniref:uncharacterized protein LOC119673941 isoform X2 n=1 Tax=Teleopsis dalmanni TaxID=139649 RepID=UPI0018CE946D|nr:uncharacterized protein LOC119673941 isoform X2 [Teleopsis dalmanni]
MAAQPHKILESIAIVIAVYSLHSDCVLGGEIAIYIFFFFLLIPSAWLLDAILLLCLFFMKNLGVDPMTIVFNFIIAIMCFISGAVMFLILTTLCGNKTQFFLLLAGLLCIISAIVHLIHGIYGHKHLPMSEKCWNKRQTKLKK